MFAPNSDVRVRHRANNDVFRHCFATNFNYKLFF